MSFLVKHTVKYNLILGNYQIKQLGRIPSQSKKVMDINSNTFVDKFYSSNDVSDDLRVYKGIYNLSCVANKNHKELLITALKTFTRNNLRWNKDGLYLIICQNQNLKFEFEIMKMEELMNLNYLRFKKLSGNDSNYERIVNKIVTDMNLQ